MLALQIPQTNISSILLVFNLRLHIVPGVTKRLFSNK